MGYDARTFFTCNNTVPTIRRREFLRKNWPLPYIKEGILDPNSESSTKTMRTLRMHSIINKIRNKTRSSSNSNETPSHNSTSSSGRIRCVCSSDLCHMGHGTYPRATRLQDGSLLGTHTAFHNGENVIVITRSTDDGVTWSPFGEVGCIKIWMSLLDLNTLRELGFQKQTSLRETTIQMTYWCRRYEKQLTCISGNKRSWRHWQSIPHPIAKRKNPLRIS